jgi:hypothetical protein
MVQTANMEMELPKVGDVVFDRVWNQTACRAVLSEVDGLDCYAQVQIIENGAAVWSSPKVDVNTNELAFGTWVDGSALPCLFDDIDGDGHPEMLAAMPKADLSPTVFRVFRWDGHSLTIVRKSSLSRNENDDFVWADADPEQEGQLVWIDDFDNGQAQIVHRRRATISRRALVVKPVAGGFTEAT